MSEASKIQWTDATWNPVAGCDKVSPGCQNCYAIRDAHRLAGNPNPKVSEKYRGLTRSSKNWSGLGARFWEAALAIPLHWRKPRRVFVNSESDLFHASITDEQIAAVFGVMAMCRRHTFQILTKRPERMVEWFVRFGSGELLVPPSQRAQAIALSIMRGGDDDGFFKTDLVPWPLPNVWLGVSAEDQQRADERIPLLLRSPAAVRFVSCEPLLGAVNLSDIRHGNDPDLPVFPDWVICGGESGPNARPMHPEWARSLRDQCQAERVPFFFKQWGEWEPLSNRYDEDEEMPEAELMLGVDGYSFKWEPADGYPENTCGLTRSGIRAAGRLLDGRTWDEFPEAA